MLNLDGKRALVLGIANEKSIAWGVARQLHLAGARLAVTYLNAKAEPHVRPLAESVDAELILPLEVGCATQAEALAATLQQSWGGVDIMIHSIAFAPLEDLHGRVVDCSAAGFAQAMDISVHSFIRLVRLVEPLMQQGGSCIAMSYYGAEKVVSTYNMMGPVKAALEATVRELASELGVRNINVNALSPGPIATRAAGGIDAFDHLLADAASRAPMRRLATVEEVGAAAAFLCTDIARTITGSVLHVDGGCHILA